MAELSVGGKKYEGWQSVRVTRSIEALCGSFELGLTEKIDARSKPFVIDEGDECRVSLDGEVLITGFIDRHRTGFRVGGHTVSVAGRDRAGDVVDCSVLLDQWEFTKVDVLGLAKKICAPYNVGVSLQKGLVLPQASIPKKYTIDPGESAGQSLQNLCKVAGVLPISDGRGNVVLSRAGTAQCSTALVEGQNILEGDAERTHTGRFRTYLVLGKHKGTDKVRVSASDWEGQPASLVKGVAKDRGVRRFARNLVIRPEHDTSKAQAEMRAQWEATTRAAQALVVTITVAGWRDGKRLWPVNELVPVKSERLRVNGPMLITQALFSRDEQSGTRTTLTLREPNSFIPQAVLKDGAGTGNNYWKEIARGV